MCRRCARYGKNTDAATVHHIYPAGEYPKYAYESENLIALCEECHNAMHNRKTAALTKIGNALKENTPLPF